MANLSLDSDGARRYFFWNLVAPSRFYNSRLCLHSCISLAWPAICGLAYFSATGSVSCHASVEFMAAAYSPINRVPSRCHDLRDRGLLVAVVARGVAGRSGVRSVRVARIGPSDD